MAEFPKITVTRKSGHEPFLVKGQPLSLDLLSFWQWSSSDLVGNALRGVLAEYIVASAVGCNEGTRTEWDAFDIETQDGVKIEVKSGAYIQSWSQKQLSTIQFSIRPTLGWDANTNSYSIQKERQSNVYVFCVLSHKDQETINPLNLDQWSFYVIATTVLDEAVSTQKTITLSRLLQLEPKKVEYAELNETITQVLVEKALL